MLRKNWRKGNGKFVKNGPKSEDKAESSNRGGGSNKPRGGKSKGFDKRKIQCYNCDRFNYFADECWSGKGKRKQKKDEGEEACIAQEEDNDSDKVLLMATISQDCMATISEECSKTNNWFLDTGCSNHVTNHKEWLVDIDYSKKEQDTVCS